MSKRYLITLKPLEPYFFGGEQTFGEGDDANYYAVSLRIPQQTTLLGMLRKEILIQSKLFRFDGVYAPEEKGKINELIGCRGFNIGKESSYEKNSYGIIDGISPVFLNKNGLYYNIGPFDRGVEFKTENGTRCFLFGEKKSAPFFNNLSKDYKKEIFMDKAGSYCIDDKDLFKTVEKIGITKNRSDEGDEGFYKKNSFLLDKDFAFSFIAELSDDEFNFKDDIVFMGGDSSKFFMNVMKEDDNNRIESYEEIFSELKSKRENSLTLLSEALVESSIYDHCDFAFSDIMDFRYIQTSTGDYKFDKSKSKSGKYNMVKKGSVFYFSEQGQLYKLKGLLSKDSLRQIGYNIYNINED